MRLFYFIIILSFCGACSTSVPESKGNVLFIEYFENGNIRKIVTYDGVKAEDSTATYFYPNGVVSKVVNYKRGLIYPGQVSFNRTGGAFIVRQYVEIEDTTLPNQSYVFDEEQNILPWVSNFAIIDNRIDTFYKVQYITSFDKSDFLIALVDTLYKDKLHAAEEWILNDTFNIQSYIFTYRPRSDIKMGFSYLTTNRDSVSWPFFR